MEGVGGDLWVCFLCVGVVDVILECGVSGYFVVEFFIIVIVEKEFVGGVFVWYVVVVVYFDNDVFVGDIFSKGVGFVDIL